MLCTLDFCIMICLMKEFDIKIKRKLNKMGELFQLPYFSDGKTKAWRKSDCPKKHRPSGPTLRLQLPFLTLNSLCSLAETCILHAMHPVWVTLHLKKKKSQTKRKGNRQEVGSLLGRGNGNPLQLFLPGKSHGQRSLVGCSPWGGKESETTDMLTLPFSHL